MRSFALLVVVMTMAGAFTGCCTTSCGVGGRDACCIGPQAADCQAPANPCSTCGSEDPCGCEPRVGLLARLCAQRGAKDCGDDACADGCGSGGLFSGLHRRPPCDSCDSCGDSSGQCGCGDRDADCRASGGLLANWYHSKRCADPCNSCGDTSGQCGCADHAGRSGGLLACFQARGRGCDSCATCGGESEQCGCQDRDAACRAKGGLLGNRRAGRSCNACGDTSGQCGCAPCATNGSTGLFSRVGQGRGNGMGCGCENQTQTCGCDQGGQCGCGGQGLLGRLGSNGNCGANCGCDNGSAGRNGFRFGGGAGRCNTCGDTTGRCGCGGGQGGLFGGGNGQGGLLGGGLLGGGVAHTGCNDCGNGWGAAHAGGAFGQHGAGCGRNGCGMGGHLCGNCLARLQGRHAHPYGGNIPHTPSSQMYGQGPMTPTYAYPYYTTRGPRDFLMANPPSIGY